MAESFKVLIVDQFDGITPYSLQKNPIQFDDLVEEVINHPNKPKVPWRQPEVRIVGEDFQPEMCTTIIRADAAGMAVAWRYRWDSSG